VNAQPRTYEESFAQWTPFYARRWTVSSRADALQYALNDILAALKAHGDERTVYTGKLYAELDAVRAASASKLFRRR
jgi:hypothetical protein